MAVPEGIHFTGGLTAIMTLKREDAGPNLASKSQRRGEDDSTFTASLRGSGNCIKTFEKKVLPSLFLI
jgi:hypothetical protein